MRKNEKEKIKLNTAKPCPLCGGCVWFIDDKYKCGWCGYVDDETDKSATLKR